MFKTARMTKKQIFFLIFIFTLVSCKSTYFPTTNHTPLFSDKGQTDITLGISRSGYELQPAYSITKKFALQSNLLYIWKINDTAGYASHYGDIAVGYNGKTDKFLYEVYAGYGIGRNFLRSSSITDTVGISKFFIQPAIGIKDDFFLVSGSTKLGLVRFSSTQGIRLSPVVEPNAHLRIGYKNIFFSTSIGLSFVPMARDITGKMMFFIFSAGLGFKF